MLKSTHMSSETRDALSDTDTVSERGDKELCAAIFKVLHKPSFAYILNTKIGFVFQIMVSAILAKNTDSVNKKKNT